MPGRQRTGAKDLECHACKRTLPVVNHKGEPQNQDVCPYCGTENPVPTVTGRSLLIALVLILAVFVGYGWLR